ncbi:MAG: dephospho-CoA kinase [Pseudomonadota bacterium]
MLTVGLTGGIASGKTQVSTMLAALGASIVDTDVIARDVVAPGSDGLQQIIAKFGDQFLLPDGALDRAALREYVFQDPSARKGLESITHPLIGAEVMRGIAEADGNYTVVVVPLLTGSRLRQVMDRVLVVDCDAGLQMRRLLARDGISPQLALSMLAAQASRDSRLTIADDVVNNSASLSELQTRCDALHRFYDQLSSGTDAK